MTPTAEAIKAKGWKGVLLRPKSKSPAGKHWQITDDPVVIGRCNGHNGNLGIVEGPEYGLAVADIDNVDVFSDLVGLLGEPGKAWVQTGRGGLHYYFKWEPGLPAKLHFAGKKIGEIQRGSETENGTGLQQVVAPPSIHPDTGKPYTWLVNPVTEPLRPLPDVWCAYLRGGFTPSNGGRPRPDPGELREKALAQPGAVQRSGGIKFQCPGCRDEGHDKHEDNAVLFNDGRWGCAIGDRTHWDAIASALGVELKQRTRQPVNLTSSSAASAKVALDAGQQDLSKATRSIFEALKKTDVPPSLFQFGGNPARLERDDAGDLVVAPLGARTFRYELAERFEWYRTKVTKDDARELVASPPMSHVENTLAADRQPFPVLRRIVRSPIVSEDGRISTKAGYDHRTKAYLELDPKIALRDVPSKPTRDEIRGAVKRITEDLFGDFPFTSGSELANAVGLFVLPFARELIHGPTPNHLVEKPRPGTGASLLTTLIMSIFEGRQMSMLSFSPDEAETRKLITSVLGTAPTFACFDNVNCEVRSGVLSKALTDSIWEDRVLGVSQQVRFPVRVVWMMTANNPTFSNEIARRTVRIRLDAKVDEPWERRDFRHPNILEWAMQHGGELIWSALVLIRAWLEAGRPAGCVSIGSYESWSAVIGGILDFSGIKGFLENRAAFYEASDTEQEGLRSFVEHWHKTFGSTPKRVKELYSFVQKHDVELPLGGDEVSERALQIRLGRLLGKHRDWQFGELRLVRGPKAKGSYLWRIEHV